MNKLTRLKSAIISGAVALTSLAAPLSSTVSPSFTATAAGGDNYAKLLQYSLYLYDANMCGDNSDCGLTWRGNCHTSDEKPGGFHDAGDHVMFGQPQGYTASTLGWAYYEFKDAFDSTGQTAHLRVITDKFAKFFRDATKLNGNTVSQVLIEKGDGDSDHNYWGAPENQGGSRRMLWTNGGAANVTAEYAAALAANYVNFGNDEDLKYAKALYEFSKKDTGYYTAGTFYDAHWTGSSDEIAWAACWLYIATKDNQYLGDVNNGPIAYSVHSWESVQLGAAILKGEITGDWGNCSELGKFNGSNYYFANEWGSARHNATAQMCSLVAAKYNKADSSWAKGQMEYLTGDRSFANGQSHCLVVGFKDNSSKNPHHRASSPDADASKQNDGIQNKYLLVGALCGGPLDANGTYQDIRSDYQGNEVAIDYNAGLVGAAAGLYHFYKSGSIETNIPGVSKIYNGSNNQQPPATTTTTTTTNNWQQPTTTTTNNWQQPPVTTTTTNGGQQSGGNGVYKVEYNQSLKFDDGADDKMIGFKWSDFKIPSGEYATKVEFNISASGNIDKWVGNFGSSTTVAPDYWYMDDNAQQDKSINSNRGTIVWEIPESAAKTLAYSGGDLKFGTWWTNVSEYTMESIVVYTAKGAVVTTTTTTTTTTTVTTTTTTNNWQPPETTTTTTQPQQERKLGDANCDTRVDLSDAILIMQALANPNKYGQTGSDPRHITQQGWDNANVYERSRNEVTPNDALAIQMKLLGNISGFPIDVL